jgi:WhiB family redox-sensing transcriptional regulator
MFAIQPFEAQPFGAQCFETDETTQEPDWQELARCNDGTGSMTELFFSEQLDDIAAAKAFCLECPVKETCLSNAQERREPWGVWGGELFVNGKIVAQKRKRGRPRKVRPEIEVPQAQSA